VNYREEAKRAAYESVIEHLEVISDELFGRGYMFYDEFEVTSYTARFIPGILMEQYKALEECDFHAHEEMVEGKGACGLIYNSSIVDMRLAKTIIHNHYANINGY